MRARRAAVVVAAYAAGTLLVPPALLPAARAAAPAPASCPLLTDPAGDGQFSALQGVPGAPHNDMLDVLSADLATGSETLVGVLRVAHVDLSDPQALQGFAYTLSWRLQNQRWWFSYRYEGGVVTSRLEIESGFAVAVPVRVSTTTNSFTWTASRAALPTWARHAVFDAIAASSSGKDGVWIEADQATSISTYTDRSAGCVPAA